MRIQLEHKSFISGKEDSVLFLKKKNQKDFCSWCCHRFNGTPSSEGTDRV
jgi:hypothetical protein